MPKLSLLIPCYRAARFLRNLREQVDAISPSFDEVLLHDDGSDDNTYSLAQSLGFQIQRSCSNAGPGAARNALARVATGEWLHFLDADDEIAPGIITSISPQLTPEWDVVLFSGDFVDPKDRVLLKRWEFSNNDFKESPCTAAFCSPIPTFCSVIRRTQFFNVGGFDETCRCWEDGDLHFRLACAGARFVVKPDVLATSLRFGGGASSNHMYCHRCRLSFTEKYLHACPHVPKAKFCGELRNLAGLFVKGGEFRAALRALRLAKQCGLQRPSSNLAILDVLLQRLPVVMGHLFHMYIQRVITGSRE